MPGLKLYGPKKNRIATFAFNLGTIHAHDVGTILDDVVIIERVFINHADIVYEFNDGKTNFRSIDSNISKSSSKSMAPLTTAPIRGMSVFNSKKINSSQSHSTSHSKTSLTHDTRQGDMNKPGSPSKVSDHVNGNNYKNNESETKNLVLLY